MHTHTSHNTNPRLWWRVAAAVTFWACKQYAIAEEMQYPLRGELLQLEQTGFLGTQPFFFFSALHKSFCLEGLSIYGNLEIPHLERKQSSSATLEEQWGEKLLLEFQGRLMQPRTGGHLPGVQVIWMCQIWGWKAKPLPAPAEASAPF